MCAETVGVLVMLFFWMKPRSCADLEGLQEQIQPDRTPRFIYLSDSPLLPQGDRPRRSQPHDHAERRHRVRTHAAPARDRDGQHRGPHGVPEPDSGAHPAGV